jgi:TetR/AcrR family transcriptional repressor of nem operon
MGRATRAQAEAHREQVVAAAARLFRERGVQAVSVADVMAAAGLTHGGFYRQFASKNALVDEAADRAFTCSQALLDAFGAQHPGDRETARADFLDYYLSPEHRDDAGNGCPAAGLGSDVSREPADSRARQAYADGVRHAARWLSDDDRTGLATFSTLVGALILARATAGTDLSREILAAARATVQAAARRA